MEGSRSYLAHFSEAVILLKISYYEKIHQIRKKTPVLESLSNKVTGYKPATLLDMGSDAAVFLQVLANFSGQLPPFFSKF